MKLLFILILVSTNVAIAAKSSKPTSKSNAAIGMHSGKLRDAGAFKVEIVSRRNGVDVYLVDKDGKSPTTANSSLTGQLYIGKKEYSLQFWSIRAKRRYFARWPAKLKRRKKLKDEVAIVLLPVRKNVIGGPVLYKSKKLY